MARRARWGGARTGRGRRRGTGGCASTRAWGTPAPATSGSGPAVHAVCGEACTHGPAVMSRCSGAASARAHFVRALVWGASVRSCCGVCHNTPKETPAGGAEPPACPSMGGKGARAKAHGQHLDGTGKGTVVHARDGRDDDGFRHVDRRDQRVRDQLLAPRDVCRGTASARLRGVCGCVTVGASEVPRVSGPCGTPARACKREQCTGHAHHGAGTGRAPRTPTHPHPHPHPHPSHCTVSSAASVLTDAPGRHEVDHRAHLCVR